MSGEDDGRVAASTSGETSARVDKIVDLKKARLMRETFEDWDRDGKGFLTRHEFSCALLSLFGCKPMEVRVVECATGLPETNQPIDRPTESERERLTERLTPSSSTTNPLVSNATFPDGTKSELAKAFERSGAEASVGGLPLSKFEEYCRVRLLLQDRDEEIRHAFKAFDSEGRGFISRKACADVFKAHASFIPSRVVDLVFDEIDIDRDGKVTYRDFVKAWNSAETAEKIEMSTEYALDLNRLGLFTKE